MNPPPTPVWTGPVILTLCIAGLAFVMSGIALGWQIIAWRRSGPRVEVLTITGIGGPPQGIWFIGVEARNSGRLGTEINSIGFQLPNGHTIQALEDFLGLPVRLPMQLGPGGSASVMYSVSGIGQALAQAGHSGKGARPFVKTGHGKVLGKERDLGDEVRNLSRVR